MILLKKFVGEQKYCREQPLKFISQKDTLGWIKDSMTQQNINELSITSAIEKTYDIRLGSESIRLLNNLFRPTTKNTCMEAAHYWPFGQVWITLTKGQ